MPNKNEKVKDKENNLSNKQKKAIGKIDKGFNEIVDGMSLSLYGTNQDSDSKDLDKIFTDILTSEIDGIVRHTQTNDVGLLARLVREDKKGEINLSGKDIETLLGSDNSEVFNFISTQYQNRCIKQNDLHEVATQLVELREAISVTRDAIVSANVNEIGVSKTINIPNVDEDKSTSAKNLIEKIERDHKLDKKIKSFIVPNTLEFGDYYVITTPYSKIFEDFEKKKKDSGNNITSMNNLLESVSKDETENNMKHMYESYFEKSLAPEKGKPEKAILDEYTAFKKDLENVFENITIDNSGYATEIDDYGIESLEHIHVLMESESKDENPTKDIFKQVSGIDDGVVSDGEKKKSYDDYSNINGCHIKLSDPMHMIEIKILDKPIGYYLVEEEDIQPISGMVSTTLYYSRFDENRRQKTIIDGLVERIVKSFDKKYLETNIELKDVIANALMYFDLNSKKLRFKYIPVEYVTKFTVNEDENGNGTSIIEPSLFYAKLYLMLLLFKIMSIILYSNDVRVNYIRTSGIDKNVANKVQEIIRQKQSRQINLMDLFSYTTLLKKLGSGSEMYIPTGRSNERGVETEILQGQDIQLNNELMDMLKKSYVLGTGVPSAIMNYLDEVDFAKSIELANTRFNGRVVTYQGDFNEGLTDLYKKILKFSGSVDTDIIDNLEYILSAPKHAEVTLKSELIQQFDVYKNYFISMYFGDMGAQDPANATKIRLFVKGLAKKFLPMIDIDEIDKLYENIEMLAKEEDLNPKNKNTDDIDNIPGL